MPSLAGWILILLENRSPLAALAVEALLAWTGWPAKVSLGSIHLARKSLDIKYGFFESNRCNQHWENNSNIL